MIGKGAKHDCAKEEAELPCSPKKAQTTPWDDLKLESPSGIVPRWDEEARPLYHQDDQLPGARRPGEGCGYGLGSSFLPRHFFKRTDR